MVVDDDGMVLVSRDELVATLDRVQTGGVPEPVGDSPLSAIEVALAGATYRLMVTRVAPADLRRAEIWLGSTGVIALPDPGDPSVATMCTAGPPSVSASVVVSALALDSCTTGGPDSVSLDDLEAFCSEVLAGRAGPTAVTLVGSHRIGDDEPIERWVIVDQERGRRADFDSDGHGAELAPCPTVELVSAVTGMVSRAVAAEPRPDW